MKKHDRRGIRISIVFVLVITIISSIVPISAEATRSLALSQNFVMVQVGSGHAPLTASISNVTWESTNYGVAQYSTAVLGVVSPIEGGYAKVTAKSDNMSASCHVCSYYGQNVANGTYLIRSEKSGRFLTVSSTSLIQRNIGDPLQKWTITATTDGYYTLRVSYKASYLACNTDTTIPTLTETYSSTSDAAKWIIKKIKYGTEDQYVFVPKVLASEGYMLSVNSENNTNGGNLLLQKWNDMTHSLCGWSLHNTADNRAAIPEWKTNMSTVAYHSGDIKTYLFLSATNSTPDYATLNNNFYAGYDTAKSQWSNALDISIATDSLGAQTDIMIYGVTYESYRLLTGAQWPDNALGSTTRALDVYRGYSFVENTNRKISIYETTNLVTMYILLDSESSLMDAVFTHEFGHAVGFDQHSGKSSHIMFPTPTDSGTGYNYTVSADEAHDLKLIYDRYN